MNEWIDGYRTALVEVLVALNERGFPFSNEDLAELSKAIRDLENEPHVLERARQWRDNAA